MYVMEETFSRPTLLIEIPTSMSRSEPEVVSEMERLALLVVPEETASTSGVVPTALFGRDEDQGKLISEPSTEWIVRESSA